LKGAITEQSIRESQHLATVESAITQSVHLALMADPVSEMQFRSKKRMLPTIQELCVLCARLDGDKEIARRFPELTEEAIETLKKAVKDYLIQKEFVQHLDSATVKIEEIQAAPVDSRAILLDDLGKSLAIKRSYDVDSDPLAMVFLAAETILKFKLREDQVVNIRKFNEAQKSGEDMVLQMIMGAGKTSVLQPVLAFLFANPERLSTVCVPPSLFAEVRNKLSQVLGDSFDQFVFVMPFNRDLSKDSIYLQTYLEGLQGAKERGACILCTPDQRKACLAGWKESLSDGNVACNEILNTIMQEFQNELVQIDEVDMTMDPGIIYKFPTGEREVVHTERATIVSQMVMRLACDPELHKKVSLDFVNKFQNRQNPQYQRTAKELSVPLYDREVAPILSRIAFEIVDEKYKKSIDLAALRKNDPNRYLEHFMLQTTPFDEAISKLCTKSEEAKLSQKLVETTKYPEGSKEYLIIQKKRYAANRKVWIEANIKDPDIRKALGVCAKSISSILRKSLLKECGSQYFTDPQSGVYTARPYFAPTSAKPSIPSDPYEQVIYSAQLVLHEGIPKDAVLDIFKNLQSAAEKEMKIEGILLNETDAYKEYTRVFGRENTDKFIFRDKPPSDALIDAYQAALNKDAKSLQDFMESYVFRQVSLFPKSISVTPQGCFGVSNQKCGYSGTVHEGILASSMKVLAELGTDGRTIAKVESDIQSGKSITRTLDSKNGSYTNQVKNIFATEKDVYVFIDSGNLLKEKADLQGYVDEVLVEIATGGRRPEIKGCVFPNAKGEWLSREMGDDGKFTTVPLSQSKLQPGERITIIPSKHETGTDIKQPPNAKAIVSIRKGMTLRDILQAFFRMRQILNAQTGDFLITKEVQDHVATLLLQAAFENEPYKSMLACSYYECAEKVAALEPQTEVEKTLALALGKVLESQSETSWNAKGVNEKFAEMSSSFAEEFAINSDAIWNYLLKNLAIDQREKNWLAGKHKMRETVEEPIRATMTHMPFAERKAVYDELQLLFEATERDDPYASLHATRQVSAQEGIDYEVGQCLKFLDKVEASKTISHSVKEQIRKSIPQRYGEGDVKTVLENKLRTCVKAEDIPSVVTIGMVEGEGEIEVEVEIEVEKEVQEEREVEVERELEVELFYKGLENKQYQQLASMGRDGYRLDSLAQSSQFSQATSLLPSGRLAPIFTQNEYDLEFSPNLFLSARGGAKIGSAEHGNYQIPGQYLLVTKTASGKDKYRLVSHEDAGKIKLGMLSGEQVGPGTSMALISFNGRLAAKVPPGSTFDLEDKQVKRAIVQAKLLTGKVAFKKSERELVKEIVGENKALGKELQTMVEKILHYMPESAKLYQISPFRKFLNELSGAVKAQAERPHRVL
ncbi:MAG: DUF3638 domain-containing protein, partial [Verrucomicrobia bacterium]|nr:DUF3638 domain-containing protein [Verrucomicrobiota bacterium]